MIDHVQPARPRATLHYIFDPLCGWCYGASPMVEVARRIPGLHVRWHSGGLFTGTRRQVVDAGLRSSLMQHDLRIGQLTGQPYGPRYFEGLLRDSGVTLDSAPPTTAMLATQSLGGQGLELLRHMQHAHYVQGRRIADPQVLRDLAVHAGLEADRFIAAFGQWQGLETQRHIATSQQWLQRVRGLGVPTFALDRGDGELQVQDVACWMGAPDAWHAHLLRELGAGAPSRMPSDAMSELLQ